MTRSAVVTGAARGIGAATTTLLRERGWRVVGIDRTWPSSAGDRDQVALDLRDSASLVEAIAGLDRIDALVNNASIPAGGRPVGELDESILSDAIEVNLKAAMVGAKAAVPALERSAGSIVNVGSVHAIASRQRASAYAATKGAVLAFTRAAAVELGPKGIRVNAVVPGAIDTAMLAPGRTGESRQSALRTLASRTPLQRVGEPSEVAAAIAFLADSEQSSFVTGHSLVIDGGALARLSTE